MVAGAVPAVLRHTGATHRPHLPAAPPVRRPESTPFPAISRNPVLLPPRASPPSLTTRVPAGRPCCCLPDPQSDTVPQPLRARVQDSRNTAPPTKPRHALASPSRQHLRHSPPAQPPEPSCLP